MTKVLPIIRQKTQKKKKNTHNKTHKYTIFIGGVETSIDFPLWSHLKMCPLQNAGHAVYTS